MHHGIELLDMECTLCHVMGSNLTKQFAILDSLQKLPLAFAQNVLDRANFALITFDCHEIGARILCLLFLWNTNRKPVP